MIQPVSKAEAIRSRLQAEGKVVYLDKPEDIATMVKMNTQLQTIRREFLVKDKNSRQAAAKVVLTTKTC